MKKRQSDKKNTKQIRIKEELHHRLKLTAVKQSTQMTDLADDYIETGLEKDEKYE